MRESKGRGVRGYEKKTSGKMMGKAAITQGNTENQFFKDDKRKKDKLHRNFQSTPQKYWKNQRQLARKHVEEYTKQGDRCLGRGKTKRTFSAHAAGTKQESGKKGQATNG